VRGKTWDCKYIGLFVLVIALGIIGVPALVVLRWSGGGAGPAKSTGTEVKLQIAKGKVISLPLEEYLIGVVAAEMPASFHLEALKAQAVAARTYALRRIYQKTLPDKHPEAHLCNDPDHCQAWISKGEMKRKWGIWHYNSYYQRIARAVTETKGEVLVYRGELIDPVYHASCGGRGTEDAADVWGYQVPYLKGVPCSGHPPQENQVAVLNFSFQEFFTRLGINDEALPAASGLGGLVEILERTGSGRVKKLQVGGLVLQGVDLRKRLGLPSTDFSVQVTPEKIVFSVRGRGHAVGLCQYGAQGMAMKGKNYREILTHYYQGVELRHLSYQ